MCTVETCTIITCCFFAQLAEDNSMAMRLVAVLYIVITSYEQNHLLKCFIVYQLSYCLITFLGNIARLLILYWNSIPCSILSIFRPAFFRKKLYNYLCYNQTSFVVVPAMFFFAIFVEFMLQFVLFSLSLYLCRWYPQRPCWVLYLPYHMVKVLKSFNFYRRPFSVSLYATSRSSKFCSVDSLLQHTGKHH